MASDLLRPRARPEKGRRTGWWSRLERRQRRFVAALGLSCAALFALSCTTGRGLAAWPEWVDNIALHRQAVPLDARQVGAGRLAQHDPTDQDAWHSFAGSRAERLAAASGRLWAYQLVGLFLLVPAAVRRRDEDAMILMLFAAFFAVTVTRYYATLWLLLFALGSPTKDGRIPTSGALAGAAMLGIAAIHYAVAGAAARYYLLNYLAYATFAILCLGYAAGDARRWWRQRRPREGL